MVGTLTVLEPLHAADRCQVAAEPERHLNEGVVDGLSLPCRGLIERACREASPEWPTSYCWQHLLLNVIA